MVWKMKRCLVACLIISALCAIQASAASPYDGNISTTYLTIFRDVVADLSPADDYVFYRSDEYEYTLVAGDLEYNGSSFSLDGQGRSYVLTYGSGYQNNAYNWQVFNLSSFNLSVGDDLVYSNLGYYPALEGRETIYAYSTLVIVFVACLASVLRYVLVFTLRVSRASD